MARVKKGEEEPKHQHNWIGNKCACGVEKMTYGEFTQRKLAWDAYYEKVKEGTAYKRFLAQRKALLNGNYALVKGFAQKAKEQLERKDFLPKPKFEDPEWQKTYGSVEIIY